VISQNTSRASEPNSPQPENTTAHCANSEPSSNYQKAAQDTLAFRNVNLALARLRAENERLREALSRLVFKIKAECAKEMPLHPEGHPYAIWNQHYPFELTHARGVIRQLGISHELIEGGETFQRIWNEYREVERSAGQ
jgi:hypothetical protein